MTLTYSFPGDNSWWDTDYSGDDEPGSYWPTNSTQQSAIVQALKAWANVTNITFNKTSDTKTNVGDMRFAYTDRMDDDAAAGAYQPGDYPLNGDVWIHIDLFNDSTAKGGYMYLTYLHEIGHAIGLNHSFKLPDAYDNYFYTVMSYTASPWTDDNIASFYPTTPMYYDLLAIQTLYGKDTTTNSGNTNYTFSGGRYFETIYDAGGTDTITYSGALSCGIYLTIGSFNTLSAPITFSDGYSSRDTVCIGPNTIIENAVGGIGSDTIVGNSVANTLKGGKGNDTVRGGGGDDLLVGGLGRDQLRGDAGKDVFDFNSTAEIGKGSTRDIILDWNGSYDYIDLSTIDANSSTATVNDAFKFVAAPGSAFTGIKGQLRWYQSDASGTANDKTYLIGDVNGDKVADFQLELRGLHTLRADLDIIV